MQCVILAAGRGTRMGPLTDTMPKTLLPVAGHPILDWIINAFRGCGIKDKEIIVVTGYHGDKIEKHLKGTEIKTIRQKILGGTGMALRQVEKHIKDKFILIGGDTILYRPILQRMMDDTDNVLCVQQLDDTSGYALVHMRDDINRVVSLEEKVGGKGFANVGVYKLDTSIFDYLDIRNKYSLIHAINKMIQSKHQFSAFVAMGNDWLDFTYPWDLLRGNETLLRYYHDGSYIAYNANVHPSAEIEPYSCIMDDVEIGYGVQIKNSIVMRGTKIPHLSYVGDSIIGMNCNLGAGTIVANLRLDGKEIEATIDGKTYKTGLRKLGVIMGHNVKTAINSSIMPATVITSNTTLHPRRD